MTSPPHHVTSLTRLTCAKEGCCLSVRLWC
uniref:Uncharacterized protein n=1 Tax=Anguilla anguilla TaxID=7936 RepID=A0A0E9UTG0_ANGAN